MTWFIGAWPKLATIIFITFLVLTKFKAGYFYRPSFKKIPFKILGLCIFSLSILTLGFLIFDALLMRIITASDHAAIAFLASFGGMLGRNVHPWLFLAFLYLLSLAARSRTMQNTVFGAFLSGILASIFSFILKFTFLRARPNAQLGPFSFFNFDGIVHDARAFQSFSSGDVAIVAGISFYFFFHLKNNALKWLLILLPFCTALSRIYANKHWPSDTILSIGLGLLAAQCVRGYEWQKTNRPNAL